MKRYVLFLLFTIFFQAPKGEGKEVYIFVVSPMVSPNITIATYQEFVRYLSAKLGKRVILKQRHTYIEVNRMLANGEADFGHVCTGAYLAGHKDFGLTLLAIPVMYGRPYYQAYIIVNSEAPYRRLEDLQGKSFVFTDPLSLTGRLYLLYRLKRLGTTPEKFFERTFFSYSHDKSIELVAEGVVEGASVDSLVYENLLERKIHFISKTKVIEKSPLFGIPPLVSSPQSDKDFRIKVLKILLKMDKDLEGKKILKKMRIDHFVPPRPELYSYANYILECSL
ncbi:PhnD/SsuA/transferrin family substrate-binding protein [Thermosulfurimonas dismutans]|uniref:Periplasmic binding protein-related protein n=1 Tax=Thermosulfurimonas dismutans TaxID=999894 RepID=A0A179D2K5_9BACT|nr:PhnD/SsuA/transferrin family substrate-binding protein [Thermosulfurimonas dismutans]OAQ20213.1 Periplasmic binding protein-related protein [Thermosulfurimonas dismutans]